MSAADYFATISTAPVQTGSTVIPLVDGYYYFADLFTEIEKLKTETGTRGVYIAGWTLDTFEDQLVLTGGTEGLIDYLEGAAATGIDVRILLWTGCVVSRAIGNYSFLYYINETEDYPNLKNKIIGNELAGAFGASHLKVALVFSETYSMAYVGGIDMTANRKASEHHSTVSADSTSVSYMDDRWHDVQSKIYGPAVQHVYDFYKDLWNSNIKVNQSNSNFYGTWTDSGFPVISQTIPNEADFVLVRSLTTPFTPIPVCASSVMYSPSYNETAGLHMCQFLRTVPDGTDFLSETTLTFVGSETECSGTAHPAGLTEVWTAFQHAINTAEKYIYVEDQGMYGTELLTALRNALNAKPELKAILVVGQMDGSVPSMSPSELADYLVVPPMKPMRETAAIREYLLDGLNDPDQVVVIYHRTAITHCKVMVIDDIYATIGSANFFDRSMRGGEIECTIAYADSGSTETVKEFRKRLWTEHFRATDDQVADHIDDIDSALAIWFGQSTTYRLPVHATSTTQLFGADEEYTEIGVVTPASVRAFYAFATENDDGTYEFFTTSSVVDGISPRDGGIEEPDPDRLLTMDEDTEIGTIRDPSLMSASTLEAVTVYPAPLSSLVGMYVVFSNPELGGFMSQITVHDSSTGEIQFDVHHLVMYEVGEVEYMIVQPFVDAVSHDSFTSTATGGFLLERFDP